MKALDGGSSKAYSTTGSKVPASQSYGCEQDVSGVDES